jgi:Protein of unknown function (DUF2510)
MTNPSPPAGWYPDPFAERWWDGESWAPIARDEGLAVTPTVVVPGATPEGWHSDPFAERWWDGVTWTETARSHWDPHELVAPELPLEHDAAVVVPAAAARRDRRRAVLLVGGAVVAAGLVGSAVAVAFDEDDERIAVDTSPTTGGLPPVVTTVATTVTPLTDPPQATGTTTTAAATTVATVPGAPNITINAATTSVWNTALPPVQGVPPTLPGTPTSAAGSTTTVTAAPTTVSPTTVSPATTGAPAESSGNRIVPRAAGATCEAPPSNANDGTPVSFGAGNLIDGDTSTAWRCQVPVDGETITLTFADRARLRSVGMIGGYTKVDPATGVDRFEENYRVKEARWTFDDGTSIVQRLEDSSEMQTMSVEARTTTVTVEILDVYPPSFPEGHSRYRPYVAISEVGFTGQR